MRAASPIACAPVEHAVTTEWFGPFNPYFIEICPDARLIRQDGMKKGLILLGPFSFNVSLALAIDWSPPIPEPTKTPALVKSLSFFASQPESLKASSAAAIAYKIKSSIFL